MIRMTRDGDWHGYIKLGKPLIHGCAYRDYGGDATYWSTVNPELFVTTSETRSACDDEYGRVVLPADSHPRHTLAKLVAAALDD